MSELPVTVAELLLTRQEELRAFAIVDTARDEQLYDALLAADCPSLCLYRGDAALRMAEVAPYLVELHPASRFTEWLLARGWGASWAVFLRASADLETLRRHFRRFLMAELPDGRRVHFRFYDPRVLRVYLPTCLPEELETFFGPVEEFIVEAALTAAPLTFRRGDAAGGAGG